MGRGWWVTVHAAAESDTAARLSRRENRDNATHKMNPNVNYELWVIKNKQNH